MSGEVSQEFKDKSDEWADIKVLLIKTRKDMSALNAREKVLKTYISDYMVSNTIDKCKRKDGSTISASKKMSKGTLTEKVIKAGLLEFLETKEQADLCWEVIISFRQGKENISLTYKQSKK